MSKPVFSIQQLSCSYDKDISRRVLFIDELEIPRGELVFLLGSSGSGKSTLLETLGLMNDTIAAGNIVFTPGDNASPVELGDLWKDENISKAAAIRKDNYSFIFQNTNLMENFTAYENICLSKMIQEDAVQETAMQGAKMLMEKVGLPESQVNINALSVNLSGGQRQRVAFVRALNSDCKVLFGDEPTGNLDEGNANELMAVVKGYLGKEVTAIVVSHDINLAVNHAHRIICLTRNTEKGYGEVLKENIFLRADWEKLNREDLAAFRDRIKKLYTKPVAKYETDKKETISKKTGYNKGFTSLFLSKEGQALAGKGLTNMFILVALLFFTFLAIGFANGSIAYLEKKINNPFVNWLTITVPWTKNNEAERMKEVLNEPRVKEKYLIKSVTSYAEMPLVFWNETEKGFMSVKARSFEADKDPLLSDIVDERNLLAPKIPQLNGFRNPKDLSLIVTKRFMNDFGYPLNSPFVYMESNIRDTTGEIVNLKVPVGVRAVVEEIPGKMQAAYTLFFYQAFKQNKDCTFDTRLKKTLIFYSSKDEAFAAAFRKTVQKIMGKLSHYQQYDPDVKAPAKNYDTYNDAYQVEITFFPNPDDYKTIDSLYKDIVADADFKPYASEVTRIYDYYSFEKYFQENITYDELSVNFSTSGKNVREFANFMLLNFNDKEEMRGGSSSIIEVDLGKVKEKENFYFLSKMTSIISYILILFATISVSLFLYNLLKSHLVKVKMNIGTFKAFGLSNAKAQNIYFLIIVGFILFSLAVSLGIAVGVGYFLDFGLHSWLPIDDVKSYFKMWDILTLLTASLILSTALLVSWFTIKNILSKSPGDLIYNR